MENFSYNSYPESGDSSPRSREIDFENPQSWEDQQSANYKVKFMCSYGGKIHPRPHDNQLAYIGGETKILAVDRSIKFSLLLAKLSCICDNAEVCFKYQLPGEDLDALISVTNDDDLEHMMNEYDRLYRASAKPARLRLFLFPVSHPVVTPSQSFGSSEGKSDRERFVEALNTGPIQVSPPLPAVVPPNNVDFLFGLEKGAAPPVAMKIRDPIVEQVILEPEIVVPGLEDRMIGLDPIQKHIQDLKRLQIEEEQAMYRRKGDDNLAGGFSGDYYVQKKPEKVSLTTLPPQNVPIPAGYWQEKQVAGGVYPASTIAADQQQVYMIQTPANMYHPQMGRPVTGPPGQGYYAVQRMAPDVYRDQPVYNVVTQAQPPPQPTLPPQALPKTTAYPATSGGGVGVMDTGYAQVAYDRAGGRQVFYTAAGGVVSQPAQPPTQYQATAAAAYSADMRAAAGNYNQEGGKVVPVKVSQALG